MKRHRHSVGSSNRVLLRRFNLPEESHRRNPHAKKKSDAREARDGPSTITHNPQPSKGSQILDVIPPDEYVQNWVATTLRETNKRSTTGLGSDLQKVNFCPFDSRSHQRHPDLRPFLLESGYVSKQPDRSQRSKKRDSRTIESSSGSSFLERGLAQDSCDESCEKLAVVSKIEGGKSWTGHNKGQVVAHLTSSADGNSLHALIPQGPETFDRRKRHKTRETHYEPTKAPKVSRGLEWKNRKVDKYTSHRKNTRTGDDLMKRFSSRSVGQDRLTMRPLRNRGIFNNGRASHSVQNNSLPDLAFSEMEFLRRSKKQMSEKDENNMFYKSREKEKRRAARAQNEVSAYFKPSTKKTVEVDNNANKMTSKHVDNSIGRYIPKSFYESAVDAYHGASSFTSSTQFADPEGPFSDFRGQGLISDTSINTEIKSRESRNLDAANKGTTCYTWSESSRSSNTASRTCERSSGISITPKSIRERLEETGIFDSTDSGSGLQKAFNGACKHSNNFEAQIKFDRTSNGQDDAVTLCGQSTAAFCIKELDPLPRRIHRLAKTLECKNTNTETSSQRPVATLTECRDGNEASLRQCDTVSKQFDITSEQHREISQDDKTKNSLFSQEVDSRRAIAEAAYLHHYNAMSTTNARSRVDIALSLAAEHRSDILTPHPEIRSPIEKSQTDANHKLSLIEELSESLSKTKSRHDAGMKHQREKSIFNDTYEACSEYAFSTNTSPRRANDVAIKFNKKSKFRVSAEAGDSHIEGRSMDMSNSGISDSKNGSILNLNLAMPQNLERLPVRNSLSGGVKSLTCQTHLGSSALTVEPLYSRQLEAQRLHDLVDLENASLQLGDQAYEASGYEVMEELLIPEDAGSATLGDYRFEIVNGETTEAEHTENAGHAYIYAGEHEGLVDVDETEGYQPWMYSPVDHPKGARHDTRFMNTIGASSSFSDRSQTNHFQTASNDALQDGGEYQLAGFWRPYIRY